MRKIFEQIIKFVGLSGIGWLMDFVVFAVLSHLTQSPFISNVLSSFVGATFVFAFSTRFVFKNNEKIPLKIKYCIYIGYQVILIFVISKLLAEINSLIIEYITWEIIVKFSAIVSKIIVTPVTMTLNFLVMKNILEKM